MPHASKQELREASDNLRAYVALVWRLAREDAERPEDGTDSPAIESHGRFPGGGHPPNI